MADRTWIRGVSQPLPAGEQLLWSGAPSGAALARHALHVRVVIGYFALLIVLGMVGALREGVTPLQMATVAGTQCLLAGLVVGGLYAYAWLTGRSTVYAITDRRVVLKVGLVLPTTINIPFRLIETAECHQFKDGTGQISLRLVRPEYIGFFHLWPHVRAWRLRYPEPMLRGLHATSTVAAFMQQAAGDSVQASVVRLEEASPELRAAMAPLRVRDVAPAHSPH